MKKYKVTFEGFVYVEAKNKTQALEKADKDYGVEYEEKAWTNVEEVNDFAVDI